MGILIGEQPVKAAHCGSTVTAMYWNGEQVFPNILPESEWLYSIENGEATLLLYHGNSETLSIPKRIAGAFVTGLEATACNYANVQSVTLPTGVTFLA